MGADSYHKRKLGNRVLQPETQMMGYGYDPKLSEGSLKPPIFLTSTFVFRNAQDGKDFFDYTSGRRTPPPGKSAGLVYSRFNNPNLEVLEDRLASVRLGHHRQAGHAPVPADNRRGHRQVDPGAAVQRDDVHLPLGHERRRVFR